MAIIIYKAQTLGPDSKIRVKTDAFLEKLQKDDTTSGLHIEPINNSLDPRFRTARVDKKYRACLFKLHAPGLPTTYVYTGTFNHDEAIAMARTQRLEYDPVIGVTYVLTESQAAIDAAHTADKPGSLAKAEQAAEAAAEQAAEAAAEQAASQSQPQTLGDLLESRGYTQDYLAEELRLNRTVLELFWPLVNENDIAGTLSGQPKWMIDALEALVAEMPIPEIKAELGLTNDEPSYDAVAEATETVGTTAKPTGKENPQAPTAEGEDTATDYTNLLAGFNHPAAQMEFKIIAEDEPLQEVLNTSTFDEWKIWLHPTQKVFVERNYTGSGKVTGGAGTGKTVVLIHRADRLLAEEKPTPPMLLTTYTRALAEALNQQMNLKNPYYEEAADPGEPGLWIAGIDSVVTSVLKNASAADERAAVARVLGAEGSIRNSTVGDQELAERWRMAILADDGQLKPEIANPTFLNDEFEQVVLTSGINSLAEYRKVARPGRGTPLNRGERARVWKIIEAFRRACLLEKSVSFAGRAAVAAEIVEASGKPLFTHTLVDEAQDFHAGHWRFLRAATATGPNDIFLAEDAHQRIYRNPVVLSHYGINTRGKASRKLTKNYRTTRENLHFALRSLEGTNWVDSDAANDTEAFQRSSTTGPEPQVLSFEDTSSQLDAAAAAIKAWQKRAEEAEQSRPVIGVLARTGRAVDQAVTGLNERGVEASSNRQANNADVRVLTMHNAKGMEFNDVILFNVDKKALPLSYVTNGLGEADREAAIQRERALLYVASSRAREELVITTGPEPSDLLPQNMGNHSDE